MAELHVYISLTALSEIVSLKFHKMFNINYSIYLQQEKSEHIFLYLCLSFGNMFKTGFIKPVQVINYILSETCMTMLYNAVKVQVHMIKYQCVSECANDYYIV